MTRKMKLYKCDVCDTLIEILDPCGLEVVCCGRSMNRLREQHDQDGHQTHQPVVERIPGGIRVRVASQEHPMVGDHHIQWIEVITGGRSYRHFLSPGDLPQATFDVRPDSTVVVRTYCNVHGLWGTSRADEDDACWSAMEESHLACMG